MRSKNKVHSKKRGQILVLLALMTSTLVILFGFVVSMGQLVQAKMNLQNAVDLAAMAGASQQARYLNRISMVNYRLRQNYKFMLFDLYVTQSRFNKGFRSEIGLPPGTFPPEARVGSSEVFGVCQQNWGYQPAPFEPGRGVAGDTDMCGRIGRPIPPVWTPYPVMSDPILIAIALSVQQIGQNIIQICNESGGQNQAYFNYALRKFEGRQLGQMNIMANALQQFAAGFDRRPLGEFGVTDIQASTGPGDQVIRDTFYKNLLSANSDVVQFGYVNPPETRAYDDEDSRINNISQIITGQSQDSGRFGDYFEWQKVPMFTVRVVDFKGNSSGCKITSELRTFPGTQGQGVFLGLARARNGDLPKVPLFVALKAIVRPKLLFWPQKYTPYLVAVGAAKPFGSRLGPPQRMVSLEVSGRPDQRLRDPTLANMSFFPGDINGLTVGLNGFGAKAVLGTAIRGMPNAGRGEPSLRPSIFNASSSPASCEAGPIGSVMCMSGAPTLYEGLFWNAFKNPSGIASGQNMATEAMGSDDPLSFLEGRVMTNIFQYLNTFYLLEDRMGSFPPPQMLGNWHMTPYIGAKWPSLQKSGKPYFYADDKVAYSSWAPTLGEDGVPGGAGEQGGRIGYQIKLTSIGELCAAYPKFSYCNSPEGQNILH